MNKFIGIGRWSKDLELRYTNSGKEVASGTIAIGDKFNKDKTDFLNVVIFGKQALNATEYTKKGSLVGIEGKVSTRNYEKDGRKVYVTEIICDSVTFLDSKNSNQENSQPSKPQNDDPFGGTEIPESELPF